MSRWRWTARKGSRIELPDIILLDINLPFSTAGRRPAIRSDPITATIPIIALNAHAMSSDKEAAIAAGFIDYCSKPVDFSDLLAKIDRHGP